MSDTNIYPPFPVVIVDDEEPILTSVRGVLEFAGINNVVCINDSRAVTEELSHHETAVVLLDLTMPHLSGQELLPRINNDFPGIPVLIVTGNSEVSTAVECMKEGAFDYLVKPVESSKLIATVRRAIQLLELQIENRTLRSHLVSNTFEHPEAFERIVTKSEKMRSALLYVEAVSRTAQTVLITGETGVGKELIAEAIHDVSGRSGELVAVNVAGFDDNMFSDTLFGHRKGAFTGAESPRKGLIETAAGGTLFLDEIGDLSKTSQVKLLRLLEAQEYLPLGSDTKKKSQARVVVATNHDLEAMVEDDSFRKDLYYRLRTHHINIPALRDRPEDIPPLVDHFVRLAAEEMNTDTPEIPRELYGVLSSYDFPGNVRELRSLVFDAMSRAVYVQAVAGKNAAASPLRLSAGVFREILGWAPAEEHPDQPGQGLIVFTEQLPTIREATECLVEEAMRRAEGKQTLAAELLGISQQALSKRLQKDK